MHKILITPRSFGLTDPAVFQTMRDDGMEVIRNPGSNIMTSEQLIRLIADCDGLIVGVDPICREVLAHAERLKAIAKYGVGLDNIDLAFCRDKGIAVSRTVGANTEAVADYTFALILAVARKVVQIDRKCRQGEWQKIMTTDVYQKTLGLVGLGAIGKSVARRAKGFSMQVIASDISWDEKWAEKHQVRRVELSQLYRQSDFISLHVPLLAETRQMIDAKALALMKPGAILINTARGGLVDENALLSALLAEKLAGAGIDVFNQEPPENSLWLSLDQVVLGSHAASSTDGAVNLMSRMAYANLKKDLG